jgi:hypothetical protein
VGAASQYTVGSSGYCARFVSCIKNLGSECCDDEGKDHSQDTPTSPTEHYPDSKRDLATAQEGDGSHRHLLCQQDSILRDTEPTDMLLEEAM